jgi:hypothetical protein
LGVLPRNVVSMVLRERLALASAGIVLDFPVVWLGAKYAEKELFQMSVRTRVRHRRCWNSPRVGFAAVGAQASRASSLQCSETVREQ